MKKRKPTNLFGSFFFLLSLSINFSLVMAHNRTVIPVNVGVVLDDLNSLTGKVWLSCIKMALSDFYASHGSSTTRLALSIRDPREDVVDAAAAALDLIKNVQVQAIIGPTSSMQANFVIDLGDKAKVPIISFSATSPSLTSIRSSYFFRAAQNDSSQVKAISAIVQAFGWRRAVPIYVDNGFGEGVVPSLVDALLDVQARVPYRCAIHPMATDDQLTAALYKLMTMQTRVFIVHMSPSLGARLFAKAQEIGMMKEGYVWIMTNGLTNLVSSTDASVIKSMQGVLGVRTSVPKTEELIDFRVRWKTQFQQQNPTIIDVELDVFALWAYDAAFALAMAVENDGTRTGRISSFQNTNASMNSSTDLLTFGVSENGPKLFQSLSNTKFKGLAGDFSFVNGQLQSPVFEIVNVNGNGAREIGFWTPESGLLKKSMNSTNTTRTYSTSKSNMGPIIWPGDSTSVPKGWEIPTDEKKLRVGVPVKIGSPEFVKVVRDPSTNKTLVSGYCIDIFNAVMEKLPYAVTYDFIPFAKPDGTSAGTYNQLVDQVYLGNFDALAAATTIRENRSLYVDFTLPYTESGVVMVVLTKDSKSQNAWVFLKPLTWDLWLTSSCFFIFIGFVIWVLEHRINEDFRGPLSNQVGTGLWFSFSTMVFAHREAVVSNLARFVVIVWVFVVLILTQSYTASLTSLLTIQELQPSFTDLNQLLKNKESVGYPKGSFVYQLLLKQGFDDLKIKAYQSPEECDDLLTKGSAKGGIAAAVDETPNLRLFIAKYCSKYTIIGPIFKTDGFAFVFPKGSALVPDVSRAILNMTDGDEMKEIDNKWFGKQATCENTKSPFSDSKSLGLNSFWGLLLIAGLASSSALMISVATFLFMHRHILMTRGTSVWKRIGVMLRIFLQRDLSSHTFRNKNSGHVVEASPVSSSIGQPSPLSLSNHTGPASPFFSEQGTPVSVAVYQNPEIPTTPDQG
ncbi:glutamate receptor 2.8-like [Prunus avium]|uniref:Glutamate receptor n=1 Tax=Prunus avium TaxID=42229 RepID=A0A6P5RUA0_PRUAV|nr:glutamate receptor 2.8-like [Prunus avium]